MLTPEMAEIRAEGGGALTIAAMDEYQLNDIGRKVYRGLLRMRQNPELWAKVKEKEAQLRAEGYFDRFPGSTRAGSV